MAVPTYLVVYILAADLGILAVVLIGLRQALSSTDWPAALRTSTLRACGALLIAWAIWQSKRTATIDQSAAEDTRASTAAVPSAK